MSECYNIQGESRQFVCAILSLKKYQGIQWANYALLRLYRMRLLSDAFFIR